LFDLIEKSQEIKTFRTITKYQSFSHISSTSKIIYQIPSFKTIFHQSSVLIGIGKTKKEKVEKKIKRKGPRGRISAQYRNKSTARLKNPKWYPVFFLSSLTCGPH
jgi:hypothetical protein